MSDYLVRPGRLAGRLTPPPSKSDAHRAMICAALAGNPELVKGLPAHLSQDLQATAQCLAALRAGESVLDCQESGTTLRLLIPVSTASPARPAPPPLVTLNREVQLFRLMAEGEKFIFLPMNSLIIRRLNLDSAL